jgi:hypothetical protein
MAPLSWEAAVRRFVDSLPTEKEQT